MTVVNGYTTLAALKRRLELPAADTRDDNALEQAIEATARDIDHHCDQFFYKTTSEARFFAPRFIDRLRFGAFNTLVSASEVAVDEAGDGTFVVWPSTDYQLLCKDLTPNVNAGPEPRPYVMLEPRNSRRLPVPTTISSGRFRVRITGLWGWPAVPTGVAEANLILATETFKLSDAPFGAAGLAELGIVRVRDNPAAQIKLREFVSIPVA